MVASGQFDRGIDPEIPGAGEEGRTDDLLIGNQIPTAQSHQINSFRDPATTVLPA